MAIKISPILTNTYPNKMTKKLNLKNAFVPFTVLGDPNLKTSLEIIKTFIQNGADMLELGLPFSDPVADGPTIQSADNRALKNQPSINDILQLLKDVRKLTNIPISILTYANLPFSYGVDKFYKQLKQSGVDAILIADLPFEESQPYLKAAKANDIHQIFLLHDQMTPARFAKIKKVATGYFYLVSTHSTTGVKTDTKNVIPQSLKKSIQYFKKQSKVPILVGFGISTQEQVATLCAWGADGVIVGSKLVKIIEENLTSKQQMLSQLQKAMLYFKHATSK